jgi:hypothetical protein
MVDVATERNDQPEPELLRCPSVAVVSWYMKLKVSPENSRVSNPTRISVTGSNQRYAQHQQGDAEQQHQQIDQDLHRLRQRNGGTASTSIVTATASRVLSVNDIPIIAIHTMQQNGQLHPSSRWGAHGATATYGQDHQRQREGDQAQHAAFGLGDASRSGNRNDFLQGESSPA